VQPICRSALKPLCDTRSPVRGLPLHAPLKRFLECALTAPHPFTQFSARSAPVHLRSALTCLGPIMAPWPVESLSLSERLTYTKEDFKLHRAYQKFCVIILLRCNFNLFKQSSAYIMTLSSRFSPLSTPRLPLHVHDPLPLKHLLECLLTAPLT